MRHTLLQSYNETIAAIDSTASIEEKVFVDFKQDKRSINTELMNELSTSVHTLNTHASVFISQYEEKKDSTDEDVYVLYSLIKEINRIYTELFATYQHINENSNAQKRTELLGKVADMREEVQSKNTHLAELRTEDTVTMLERADISYEHLDTDKNRPSTGNHKLHVRIIEFFNLGVQSSLIILAMFIIALYQLLIQGAIISGTTYLLAICIALLFRKYVLPYLMKVITSTRHKIAKYTR